MNAIAKVEPQNEKLSLIKTMSTRYGMEPDQFKDTVFKTCMPANATTAEFAAFLLVANEHGLNPVTREIYAFPKKGGGIQPIVGIDGWLTLINSQPKCDGVETVDNLDSKGNIVSITCKIYRKDRSRPTEVTEYMDECKRPTEPWQKWPARMLRHKAVIQCARYAFGFAGIIDPEEAERSPEVETGQVTAPPPPPPAQQVTADNIVDADFVPFDLPPFHARLDEELALATDADTLQEAWDAMDVEATCDGDDALWSLCEAALDRHRERLNISAE